ncbi:hypothetical protein HS7_09180 [Sulfolobales archaeon HS-7]|nr:hypothetical protein HS7_09180 [Sulfolobales archaeon HS-7]
MRILNFYYIEIIKKIIFSNILGKLRYVHKFSINKVMLYYLF